MFTMDDMKKFYDQLSNEKNALDLNMYLKKEELRAVEDDRMKKIGHIEMLVTLSEEMKNREVAKQKEQSRKPESAESHNTEQVRDLTRTYINDMGV